MKTKLVLGSLAVLSLLGGCKASFASDPVRVPTAQGDVICQLYNRDMVWWDEALRFPRTMGEQNADDICIQAGHKLADK